MSRRCQICDKGSRVMGVRKLLRGHLNPTTKRRRRPNLQWFTQPTGRRVLVCTSCLNRQTQKLTQPPKFAQKKKSASKKPAKAVAKKTA